MSFAVDNKKIAKNTIALYVRTAITMVISFLTARVTLQVLGVDDYGLNNLVGSVVALFSFLNASMGTAVQRFFNIEIGKGNDERLKKVYGVGMSLHIVVAAITVVIAEVFAIFFLSRMNIPEERMTAAHVVFQISILSMAASIINVPNYALVKARELFSQMAMIEIVQALLRLVVLYFLYIIDYDKLIIFALLNLGVTAYYVLSLFRLARRFPESHQRPCRDRQLEKEMLTFISLLIVTVLAELGRKQGLVMLINLFFGLAVNAAYAIAVQVSNLISTFVINIKQPIIPQMMAAYGAGDKRSMFTLITFGTKITALMMLLMTFPLVFEIDYLLQLWLKTPPEYSSQLAVLVLVNINISSFTYFLYQGVHATGNIKRQQIWMSGSYILNIVLIYLAFKMGYGFYSALYVTMSISVCQNILNMAMAKRYYGYDIRSFLIGSLAPCLVLAIIVSPLLYAITQVLPSSFLRVVVLTFVGTALTLALGYYLVLNKEERIKTKSFLKQIKINRKG